tara:strand:+ start:673 stop:1272 length:600 start_codon:yes stop_codon:yes gene_type:complete
MKKTNLIYGVAYNSRGKYNTGTSSKHTKDYAVWQSMTARCYDRTASMHKRYKHLGVTVCDGWLDFQVFAEWFENNYIEGFALDKDLTNNDSKQYSPENCAFIPSAVNSLLTANNANRGDYPVGVYWQKKNKKFMAKCRKGSGRQKYLGLFVTPELAFSAYKEYKEDYIKQTAQEHYSLGNISEAIYNNLMTWEVVPFPE